MQTPGHAAGRALAKRLLEQRARGGVGLARRRHIASLQRQRQQVQVRVPGELGLRCRRRQLQHLLERGPGHGRVALGLRQHAPVERQQGGDRGPGAGALAGGVVQGPAGAGQVVQLVEDQKQVHQRPAGLGGVAGLVGLDQAAVQGGQGVLVADRAPGAAALQAGRGGRTAVLAGAGEVIDRFPQSVEGAGIVLVLEVLPQREQRVPVDRASRQLRRQSFGGRQLALFQVGLQRSQGGLLHRLPPPVFRAGRSR